MRPLVSQRQSAGEQLQISDPAELVLTCMGMGRVRVVMQIYRCEYVQSKLYRARWTSYVLDAFLRAYFAEGICGSTYPGWYALVGRFAVPRLPGYWWSC